MRLHRVVGFFCSLSQKKPHVVELNHLELLKGAETSNVVCCMLGGILGLAVCLKSLQTV